MHGSPDDDHGPRRKVSDPTPQEISEACEAIQATWSALERQRRARGRYRDEDRADPPPFTVPTGRIVSSIQ